MGRKKMHDKCLRRRRENLVVIGHCNGVSATEKKLHFQPVSLNSFLR